MGRWATVCSAAVGVAAVSLVLCLPRPFPDRLAVIPEAEARIDNVKPYDSVEKWAPNGSQAGLHLMNPARVEFFDNRIRAKLQPPFRVLDLGCGGGLVASALARLPGYTIEGVDLSPESLSYAKTTAAAANLRNVHYQNASVYAVPFGNDSFDVVIMSDVLEHLLDLPKALREVSRVLRPGGVFLFDTLDRTLASFVVAIAFAENIVGIMNRGTHDWRLFVRPDELQEGLRQAGLADFTYEAFTPTVEVVVQLALWGYGLLPASSLTAGFYTGPAPLGQVISYIGSATKPQRG